MAGSLHDVNHIFMSSVCEPKFICFRNLEGVLDLCAMHSPPSVLAAKLYLASFLLHTHLTNIVSTG